MEEKCEYHQHRQESQHHTATVTDPYIWAQVFTVFWVVVTVGWMWHHTVCVLHTLLVTGSLSACDRRTTSLKGNSVFLLCHCSIMPAYRLPDFTLCTPSFSRLNLWVTELRLIIYQIQSFHPFDLESNGPLVKVETSMFCTLQFLKRKVKVEIFQQPLLHKTRSISPVRGISRVI